MNQEKRIINEPNLKIEITKTTGRYAKNEATVSYSGNINEFNADLWQTAVVNIQNAVLVAIHDIIEALKEPEG